MRRLVCDEDFDGRLLAALRSRCPQYVFERVQDIGLGGEDGATDRTILRWAATVGVVVLTHDRNTMTAFAAERLATGETVPGVIVVRKAGRTAQIVEDIRLLVECGPDTWDAPVMFVPLR